MRRFLLIAAAAMIALIGLSANQCSGGKEDKAEPAAAPSDNMGSDKGSMGSDTDNMGGDSSDDMQDEPPSE